MFKYVKKNRDLTVFLHPDLTCDNKRGASGPCPQIALILLPRRARACWLSRPARIIVIANIKKGNRIKSYRLMRLVEEHFNCQREIVSINTFWNFLIYPAVHVLLREALREHIVPLKEGKISSKLRIFQVLDKKMALW